MTKSIVSKAIEIPVAPLSPGKFDTQSFAEELIEEILEGVFMQAESAQLFEETKLRAEKVETGRRKVIRNNMDYLMTVIEERHRNADSVYGVAAGGLDIRYSVKECYRKFFIEEEDQYRNDEKQANPNKIENQESFEVSPTLGVREEGGEGPQRGTIKGPGSLLQSVSE
jgi:hypothetical protein